MDGPVLNAFIIAGLALLSLSATWGALRNRIKNLEDWRDSHELISQQNLVIIQQMQQNIHRLNTLAEVYVPRINELERKLDHRT